MAINRTTLFAYLRKAPFGSSLSTDQVKGVEAILEACVSPSICGGSLLNR